MNYDYIRPELVAMLPTYQLCSDCFAGEKAVKYGRSVGSLSGFHGNGGGVGYGISPYLPDPSPANENDEVRRKRYEQYLQRAVFYNVTRRTVKAMVGAVFSKYPTYTLDGIELLAEDVSGGGVSLAQQAKDALTEVLIKGRVGLLADFPVNAEGVSKADMVTSGIRPTVRLYQAESIINWRTVTVGAITKLSLVVLSETYTKSDDGYKEECGEQLLILRLNDDGLAESEVVRKTDSGWVSQGINKITDNSGRQLDTLPFLFAGSENNDEVIDDSPIYDIAQINIAHFRTSADYEEMSHISSQPTLIISGLTQEWVDSNMTAGVSIGSRSGLLLPQGGDAKLIQAESSGVLFESMQHKEQLMKSLGAKLIEANKTSQVKTATQAASETAEETSVLANVANNTSDAITKALQFCARFMGVDPEPIVFTLNTNFSFNKLSEAGRMQLMQEWQAGLISFAEARAVLVENEVVAEEDSEKAKAEIDREQGELLTQDRI